MSTTITTDSPSSPIATIVPLVGPALNLLPPELKALIVEHIAAVDEEDEDDGFEDEDDEDEDDEEEHDCSNHAPGEHHHHHSGKKNVEGEDDDDEDEDHEHKADGSCCSGQMSAMLAISLVNREFAELAYPYLYKAFGLDTCSNVQLSSFITDVLPSKGKYIEMISINLEDFSDYESEDTEATTAVEEAIQAIVFTEKRDEDYGNEFSIRQRHNLVSEIFKMVPNLDTVDLTIDPITNSFQHSGEGALKVLQTMGEQIIDLTLDSSGSAFDSSYISKFLTSFPNLLRLDLDFPSMDRNGELELIKTISSFPKVTNLYISSAEYVNEDFAKADWKSPLETLALSECEEFKFSDFITLVEKFSTTLKHLDIDEVPDHSNEVDNKKCLGKALNLPILESLVLATQHSGTILASFSNCPIKELAIAFCPSITTSEWESFIVSHQSTLKSVTIQNDSDLSEPQIESLELFLLTKGITCDVEPESSDDEEDDDEDEYESDNDDLAQWGAELDEDDEEESEDEDSEGDGFSGEEEI